MATVRLPENHPTCSRNEPYEIAAVRIVADRGTGGAKQDAGVSCLTIAAEIDGDLDLVPVTFSSPAGERRGFGGPENDP